MVVKQRQLLAFVLVFRRLFEHGEDLLEQLAVLGAVAEAAVDGAGVVVDTEPAVLPVGDGAQEGAWASVRLRELVAGFVLEARGAGLGLGEVGGGV